MKHKIIITILTLVTLLLTIYTAKHIHNTQLLNDISQTYIKSINNINQKINCAVQATNEAEMSKCKMIDNYSPTKKIIYDRYELEPYKIVYIDKLEKAKDKFEYIVSCVEIVKSTDDFKECINRYYLKEHNEF